jgi:hypothetical protein
MVSYGAVAFLYLKDEYGDVITKDSYSSMCTAAGFQYALNISRTWAVDFDVVYITDDSKLEDRIDVLKSQGYIFEFANTGNIKISFGIRFIF